MIGEVQELLRGCLRALPLWMLLRGAHLLLRRPRRRPKPAREAVMGLFAIFMVGLLQMVLDGEWQTPAAMLESVRTRMGTMDRIHLRPFQTIGPQLRALPDLQSLTQLLGNTLLFAPWGFCLPLLWPRWRSPGRMIMMALALTCFIEFTQLFIDRYVEIDDVLLNFLGSMLGAGLWWLLHRCRPGLDRHLL